MINGKVRTISELNRLREIYGQNFGRGLLTFLDNIMIYMFNKKPRRGPLYIGWDITFRCNAKCPYCDSWKRKPKKELTTKEALKVIREAGKLKVWVIGFTGGEPLLRNDIFLLIKEARKQKINVNINTNGFFLKKFAKQLIDSGVNSITVSADSHIAEEHDKIRKIKLFDKLIEGINEINKLRVGNTPKVMVRSVLTKNNYKNAEKYIKFWENKVDEIIFQPLHDKTADSITNVQDKKMKFIDKDKVEFSNYFNKLMKKHKWLSRIYYKEFPTYLFSKEHMLQKYKCFAGFYYIQLDPYGNVFSCGSLFSKVGNVTKGLYKVWTSKELTKFRYFVKNKKNTCVCWCTNDVLNVYLTKLLPDIRK